MSTRKHGVPTSNEWESNPIDVWEHTPPYINHKYVEVPDDGKMEFNRWETILVTNADQFQLNYKNGDDGELLDYAGDGLWWVDIGVGQQVLMHQTEFVIKPPYSNPRGDMLHNLIEWCGRKMYKYKNEDK